jgi:hypothetical protein
MRRWKSQTCLRMSQLKLRLLDSELGVGPPYKMKPSELVSSLNITVWRWGTLPSIVTRLRTGRPGFNSRQGAMMRFLFSPPRPHRLWGPPGLLYPWVPVVLSSGLKQPAHSPLSSAEVKNSWSYTSTSQYIFMALYLVKHRDFASLTRATPSPGAWHLGS